MTCYASYPTIWLSCYVPAPYPLSPLLSTSQVIPPPPFPTPHWSQTPPFCWALPVSVTTHIQRGTSAPHAYSITSLFIFVCGDICGGWNDHMVIFAGRTFVGPCTSCTTITQFWCRVSCIRQHSNGCFLKSRTGRNMLESCKVVYTRAVSSWWSLDQHQVSSWSSCPRITSTSSHSLVYR